MKELRRYSLCWLVLFLSYAVVNFVSLSFRASNVSMNLVADVNIKYSEKIQVCINQESQIQKCIKSLKKDLDKEIQLVGKSSVNDSY